jgi:hypothetical protein
MRQGRKVSDGGRITAASRSRFGGMGRVVHSVTLSSRSRALDRYSVRIEYEERTVPFWDLELPRDS